MFEDAFSKFINTKNEFFYFFIMDEKFSEFFVFSVDVASANKIDDFSWKYNYIIESIV